MSLINCKECNKEISDSAKICTNCGAKTEFALNRNKSRFNAFKITISAIAVFGVLFYFIVIKHIQRERTAKINETKQYIAEKIDIELEILKVENYDLKSYPALAISQERELRELAEKKETLNTLIEFNLSELKETHESLLGKITPYP